MHLSLNFRPARVLSLTILVMLLIPAFCLASQLGKQVLPVSQKIDMTIDARQPDYSGSVEIVLKVTEPTDKFSFHSEGLTLGSVILTQNDKPVELSFEQVSDFLIEVTTKEQLSEGDYLLKIAFTNEFDTRANSLYRMETEGLSYVFTQLEATEAREAFPCWDEPLFKIPFEMTLTVPQNHTAVSNTPIVSEESTDGYKVVRFAISKPMPSYLIAIATGQLESVDMPGLGVPAKIYVTKGKTGLTEIALKSTPPILKALEEYFDRPYPYKKLDFIAVPEFWPGAMENVGAITYAEGLLLIDSKTATVSQRRRQASVIAHELAHMWFGDLVTMEWWDDLWLNEAFATWMGTKIVQQVFPQYQINISSLNASTRAMNGDARPSAVAVKAPVGDPDNLLQNIGSIYSKGSAILIMFEQYIGPEQFRKGVLGYISAHEWGNAMADDLYSALEESANTELSGPIASFTSQPGVPLVGLESLGNNRYRLTQTRFANYGVAMDGEQVWQIPVSLKILNGDKVTTKQVFLSEPSMEFELETDGEPDWVLPNTDFGGYYRWITPPEMLLSMAANATEHLTPRERIGFIKNLAALLDAGTVSGDDYLKVIERFAGDPDPQIISAVISALGKVEFAFVPDSLSDDFSVYVRQTLTPALERFGMTKQEGEDEIISTIRPQLIGWLADEGKDMATLAFLNELTDTYMNNPEEVDNSLVGVALRLTCRGRDSLFFNECKNRFENAQTPRERRLFLSALGAFDNDQIIANALEYVFEGPLRPQEISRIPNSIEEISEARAMQIFKWYFENYDEIISHIPPVYIPYMAYLGSGCSAEKLKTTENFFAQPERANEGISATLLKVSDQVNDCVSLRDREGKAVADYLKFLSN